MALATVTKRIADGQVKGTTGGMGSRTKRYYGGGGVFVPMGTGWHNTKVHRIATYLVAAPQPVKRSAPAWLTEVVDVVVSHLVEQRIDRENAISALLWLGLVMDDDTPPPIVVPTVSNGLQFEWHSEGIDLEIQMDPGDVGYVAVLDAADGADWAGEVPDHEDDIREMLALLTTRRQLRRAG